MILSIDADKAYDKIQHPFLKRSLHRVGIEGIYLNIIKVTYERLRVNIILNGDKVRNTTGMSTLTTVVHILLEVLASAIKQQKEIKGIQIGQEEIKLSLFPDDMILCVENPKDSTRNC